MVNKIIPREKIRKLYWLEFAIIKIMKFYQKQNKKQQKTKIIPFEIGVNNFVA